jgi:hypothetical protein
MFWYDDFLKPELFNSHIVNFNIVLFVGDVVSLL